MDPLVSTDWLAAELGARNLVVLDATVFPPGDGRDARAQFLAARIPGARRFDIDQIADHGTTLPHMVPSAEYFAQQMEALGVSNEARVVCYDQLGMFSAPRAWWMLRLFGHDQVAVLDGGWPKWRAEQRAVEQGAPSEVARTRFRSSLRARLLRGLGDVRDNLNARRELVLDASLRRSVSRARGGAACRAAQRPYSGARNLPFGRIC